MIYELKNEKLTVKVSSLGAELISAVGADGHEYVLVSMFVNGRDNAVSDARHIYETYCR